MGSEPCVLGFDTAAAHCAAAVLSGGTIAASRHEAMARGQAERLFPLLGEVLAEARVGWRDLAVIGVGVGPGNFTGLRIAVAAARGLALSLARPAIGVSRFEAQAEGIPRPLVSMIPAPRDQVYLQRLERDRIGPPRLVSVAEAGCLADREGLTLVGAPLGVAPALPLAEAVAVIAARRARAEAAPERPVPLYVRPADAARAGTAATLRP